MRRIFTGMSLLIMILIASCNLPARSVQQPPTTDGTSCMATATLSSIQMQTQISAMLTVMPTATEAVAGAATPTMVLPTVEIGGAVATATSEATPESQSPTATETAAPVVADTEEAAAVTVEAESGAETQSATSTPSAGDPRSRLGDPDSTDPMDNPDYWIWPTGWDKFSAARFRNGTQRLKSLDPKDGWRMANPEGRDFTNIYLEATFKTGSCSGMDHYGIILRVPVVQDPDQGYLFGVSCDGHYSLRRWNANIGPKGEMKKLVEWTASSAINSGSNKTNRLGIFAVGKRLILYVNGQLLTEVSDSRYPAGYFGAFVGQVATEDFAVELDEMSYWENPQP